MKGLAVPGVPPESCILLDLHYNWFLSITHWFKQTILGQTWHLDRLTSSKVNYCISSTQRPSLTSSSLLLLQCTLGNTEGCLWPGRAVSLQQAGEKPQHCRATRQSSRHIGGHHSATPAKPLLLMRCSCQEGQHGMGGAPTKGFSPLCAPGLPIPLHGLQSTNSQAGSWQIIPSSPGWTLQGITGESHDSFPTLPQQQLEDNGKSCTNWKNKWEDSAWKTQSLPSPVFNTDPKQKTDCMGLLPVYKLQEWEFSHTQAEEPPAKKGSSRWPFFFHIQKLFFPTAKSIINAPPHLPLQALPDKPLNSSPPSEDFFAYTPWRWEWELGSCRG